MHKNVLNVIVERSEIRDQVTYIDSEQILLHNLVGGPLQTSEFIEQVVNGMVLPAAKHAPAQCPGDDGADPW